jgi:hypothetical protein
MSIAIRACCSCGDAPAHHCILTGIRQLSCQRDNCYHLSRRQVVAVVNFAHYKLLEIEIYYMVRKLKGETLDCTLGRNRFGRGCGPVTRQTVEWMNKWMNEWVSEWTNESVTWTNAVCNADHGNHAVERATGLRSRCARMFISCPLHWRL